MKCSDCEEPLDEVAANEDERQPCPACGSSKRTISASIEETVVVTDAVSSRRIREWIETNWLALFLAALLTVTGFLVDHVLGIAVAAVATAVGAKAFTDHREVDTS